MGQRYMNLEQQEENQQEENQQEENQQEENQNISINKFTSLIKFYSYIFVHYLIEFILWTGCIIINYYSSYHIYY